MSERIYYCNESCSACGATVREARQGQHTLWHENGGNPFTKEAARELRRRVDELEIQVAALLERPLE